MYVGIFASQVLLIMAYSGGISVGPARSRGEELPFQCRLSAHTQSRQVVKCVERTEEDGRVS